MWCVQGSFSQSCDVYCEYIVCEGETEVEGESEFKGEGEEVEDYMKAVVKYTGKVPRYVALASVLLCTHIERLSGTFRTVLV